MTTEYLLSYAAGVSASWLAVPICALLILSWSNTAHVRLRPFIAFLFGAAVPVLIVPFVFETYSADGVLRFITSYSAPLLLAALASLYCAVTFPRFEEDSAANWRKIESKIEDLSREKAILEAQLADTLKDRLPHNAEKVLAEILKMTWKLKESVPEMTEAEENSIVQRILQNYSDSVADALSALASEAHTVIEYPLLPAYGVRQVRTGPFRDETTVLEEFFEKWVAAADKLKPLKLVSLNQTNEL